MPIIFSLGFGTADIEEANRDGKKVRRQSNEKKKSFERVQITKGVRWVEINDLMFVFLGATCINVVGEP